jgi:hypothetical protein
MGNCSRILFQNVLNGQNLPQFIGRSSFYAGNVLNWQHTCKPYGKILILNYSDLLGKKN